MTYEDRLSENAAVNMVEAVKRRPGRLTVVVEPHRDTGAMLAGRRIEDEIPVAALRSHALWKEAVAARDMEAMVAYDLLGPGRPNELDVTFLADRIDKRDPEIEEVIIAMIFGPEYAKVIHPVLRDEAMRRSAETRHAMDRLRLRLEADCATPTDARRVQRCAAETVGDDLMWAFVRRFRGKDHLVFHIDECRYVTSPDDQECLPTGLPIPAGERFVLFETTGADGVERHVCISRAVVWCYYIIGDVDLSYALSLDPKKH